MPPSLPLSVTATTLLAAPSATPSSALLLGTPRTFSTVPILNYRATLLGLLISFMIFSWVCSLLRLYTRFVILHTPGWDDFFMIIALVSTAAGSIVLCILPDYGLGKPVATLTLPQLEDFLRILYVGHAMYPVSATFIKLALLFQYLRVFKPGSRTRVFCKWMIVISAAWGTTFTLLRWIPCYPVSAYWDLSLVDAHRWGFSSRDPLAFMHLFVGQAVSTAVLDSIVFAIPIPLCFKHDTSRKTRLYLVGLMILGSLTVLCAILRMVYVIQHFTVRHFRFDPTWDNATTAGLACLEVDLASVCAALPIFWPVLTTAWGRIFVTTEVSVTREVGPLHPRKHSIELEGGLHTTSSHQSSTTTTTTKAMLDRESWSSQGGGVGGPSDGWTPYVGDETTGLGENTTVVEAPRGGKKPGWLKGGKCLRKWSR